MNITDKEKGLLIELLTSAQAELIHQLHHTDTQQYKKMLKEKASLLEALQEKLKAEAAFFSSGSCLTFADPYESEFAGKERK